MKVSVVLGSYNRYYFIKKTIDSIRRSKVDFDFEIIVVDGGSTDGTLKWLIRQKDIITIAQHNRGTWRGKKIKRRSWGYFMNLAYKAAQGKYVLMVSDDCLLYPDSMAIGVKFAEDLEAKGVKVGVVPYYWRNWPDNKDYFISTIFGDYVFLNHGLFAKAALEEVGYADEDRYFFYSGDVDLSLRILEKKWEIVPCETAFVEHYGHSNWSVRSGNAVKVEADSANLHERWKGIFYFDKEGDDVIWLPPPSEEYNQFPKKYWWWLHFLISNKMRARRVTKRILKALGLISADR